MSSDEGPTRTALPELPAGAAEHRGFAPGFTLAGRYRIVGLLGKGGMGEVYRADDLKLGQPVALKFLPRALGLDPSRLARFLNEVRVAREVSHPNVCRVHDIGEVEGHHFLSMEYVDGEDLASLLRRIGRLPKDKGVEIAWQICAGLAAAHDRGVLHRDLKPANIMIDGRGRARLTDFGLAVVAGEAGTAHETAGTPAYMAPEQLQGLGASVPTDIYALGLVLYELFTGRPPFRAASLPELARMQRETPPPRPLSLVSDLEPALERVILRCLEKDPAARHPSARAVMAALPGGDPLQAALAAGETPSPEMVAAAGTAGDLPSTAAWAGLLFVLAGLVAAALLSAKTLLYRQVPFGKSPEVLAERAQEIARKAGYLEPPADWAGWFDSTETYLRYLDEHDPSPTRFNRLATADREVIHFVYRQSPEPLEPQNRWGEVWWHDPPLRVPGMVSVVLGTGGRLACFRAVPPAFDDTKSSPAPTDWRSLLSEAGFDLATLVPSDPEWTPPLASDARIAWQVKDPQPLAGPIRVEAASYRGRPVSFQVLWAWDRPEEGSRGPESPFSWLWRVGFIHIGNAAALLGAVILARRNLRLGRGDRSGAMRIALVFFTVSALSRVLGMHHVPAARPEWSALERSLEGALWDAAKVFFFYLALEPYARRRWPRLLIAWNRLLGGRLRDPLVGREALLGALCGAAMALLWHASRLAPNLFGIAPSDVNMGAFGGARPFVGQLLEQLGLALYFALINLFLLIFYRIVTRDDRLAVLVVVVSDVVFNLWMYPGRNLPVEIAFLTLIFATAVFALMRFGLLALVAALVFFQGLHALPLTLDLTAWYAGYSVVNLLALTGLAAYLFHTSLGGKPLFGPRLLDQ